MREGRREGRQAGRKLAEADDGGQEGFMPWWPGGSGGLEDQELRAKRKSGDR